jgi:hypothetical protein
MSDHTVAQMSALIRANAAYYMAQSFRMRMMAEHDERYREIADMLWVTACLWLEIERFACR